MGSKIGMRAALLSAATLLAGCASDGSGPLTTNSITDGAPAKTAAAAPKVDPACVTLASQIDTLRQEGTVGRLEKVAEGKTPSVQVKRTSIAKQAELNKLNAEFQARCSSVPPKSTTAALAPAAAAAPAPAAAVAAPVAAKPAAETAKKVVKKAAPAKTSAAVKTVTTVAATEAPAKPAALAPAPAPVAAAPEVVPSLPPAPAVVTTTTLPPKQ